MPRRCRWVKLPNGATALVTSDVRLSKCEACGARVEDVVLCDWPLAGKAIGRTCDAQCCRRCARRVGPNRDYCPAHARLDDAQRKLALDEDDFG